jgi:hypothetical protein
MMLSRTLLNNKVDRVPLLGSAANVEAMALAVCEYFACLTRVESAEQLYVMRRDVLFSECSPYTGMLDRVERLGVVNRS